MTAHRPGDPVWVQLLSDSIGASIAFYGPLFGWRFVERAGRGGHVIFANEDAVGVAAQNADAGASAPGPPRRSAPDNRWIVHLAAPDAAEVARRARSLGLDVVDDAVQIPGAGRLTAVRDASIGLLGAWQQYAFPGPRTGADGLPCWFELESPQVGRARVLLREVFDWDPVPRDVGGRSYYTHHPGDQATAALYDGSRTLPQGAGARWHVYFAVPDVDSAVRRVRELGGQVDESPEDTPIGRLASARDPLGAGFHLAQPVPERAGARARQ